MRDALDVAMALHYQASLERSNRVRFTRKLRERFGIESRSAGRALSKTEVAGLVTRTRKPGCCHVVDIPSRNNSESLGDAWTA